MYVYIYKYSCSGRSERPHCITLPLRCDGVIGTFLHKYSAQLRFMRPAEGWRPQHYSSPAVFLTVGSRTIYLLQDFFDDAW